MELREQLQMRGVNQILELSLILLNRRIPIRHPEHVPKPLTQTGLMLAGIIIQVRPELEVQPR